MTRTDTITRRIEELAPGFSETILETHVFSPSDLERRNPNYVGGDISGGAHIFPQLVFRPFPQVNPYTTPIDGVYVGSSSTPPGAVVTPRSPNGSQRRARSPTRWSTA